MSDRNTRIIEAAGRLFSRYGVSKTTMNDIAREAGVARQTLYNAYPSKDEILRGAVQSHLRKTLDEIVEAWMRVDGLDAKLQLFFDLGPLAWYDQVKSSPEMEELVDGIHSVAKAEMEHFEAQWIRAFQRELEVAGVLAEDRSALADFVYSSATNAKYSAGSRDILVKRLELLRKAVVRLVQNG